MENNEAFETEIDLTPSPSRSQNRALSPDQAAFAAGYGTIDPPDHAPQENDPFLGHPERISNDTARTTEYGNNGSPGPPEWSGERDFEGLPWWRTPSVCST